MAGVARNGSSATQHPDHAISSDIAIMHNREIKTAEQLARHRLYDTRDHRATHITRKIAKDTSEVTDPSLQQAEANIVV